MHIICGFRQSSARFRRRSRSRMSRSRRSSELCSRVQRGSKVKKSVSQSAGVWARRRMIQSLEKSVTFSQSQWGQEGRGARMTVKTGNLSLRNMTLLSEIFSSNRLLKLLFDKDFVFCSSSLRTARLTRIVETQLAFKFFNAFFLHFF